LLELLLRRRGEVALAGRADALVTGNARQGDASNAVRKE
jgi:hypothetical protein